MFFRSEFSSWHLQYVKKSTENTAFRLRDQDSVYPWSCIVVAAKEEKIGFVTGETRFLRTYLFLFLCFAFTKNHLRVPSSRALWLHNVLCTQRTHQLVLWSTWDSRLAGSPRPFIQSIRCYGALHSPRIRLSWTVCLADSVRWGENSKDCSFVLFFWTIDKQAPHSPTLLNKIRFNVGTGSE